MCSLPLIPTEAGIQDEKDWAPPSRGRLGRLNYSGRCSRTDREELTVPFYDRTEFPNTFHSREVNGPMIVTVIAMGMVQPSVYQIIDVVTMRHHFVPTPWTMLM
jgi:hypothetical protein